MSRHALYAAIITTKIFLARCEATRRHCSVSEVIRSWLPAG